MRYRCAYVESGNGIAERCHRTVKRIAARCRCSIGEALYWYNVSPKDNVNSSTAPVSGVYRYPVRLLNVDTVEPATRRAFSCPFVVGDNVWVKPEGVRCDREYDRGVVTNVVSDVAVEVNGMPRHVRDLRLAAPVPHDDPPGDLREKEDWDFPDVAPVGDPILPVSSDESAPRRSTREVQAPDRYGVVPW